MRTLIVDNYDSFTYNLVHLVELFTDQLDVRRNNEIEIEEVDLYNKIIISPGPGLPQEAGITLKLIERYSKSKEILGICLGMQAIAECFNGKLKNIEEPMHGISTSCELIDRAGIFKGMEKSIVVGHYHSWVIDPDHVPDNFDITAQNKEGLIMAIKHRELQLEGVQFHPESILTPNGRDIIKNWMNSGS